MDFRIELADSAFLDAEEYVSRIRDLNREPGAAKKWFRGLIQAVYSLERNPWRCPMIPEAADAGIEGRHLIYYSHVIIFSIDESSRTVFAHRIFHGQRQFRSDDLT